MAVSGFGLCLQNGKPLPSGKDPNPRTGFGLSQDRRFLFLMTIDGRQPRSVGSTTEELGTLLLQAGAADPATFRPTERTNGNNFGVAFELSK